MNGTIVTRSLGNGIWVFNESRDGREYVDAYLIVGKNRALVVDSLQDEESLYKEARKLTDLPLDVVVTHGHVDHTGVALKAFHEADCAIYMDERDLSMLKPGIEASWFKPLNEGMSFDLGGYKLEVLSIPGHSPGSVVLLDRENQLLFTGDSIGAGVFWMQIPTALSLSEFLGYLEKLCDAVKDYTELKIHPGHRHQAPVQLTREFLDDVLLMTRNLVSGEWQGEDAEMDLRDLHIKYKKLSYKLMTDYCYNPDKI